MFLGGDGTGSEVSFNESMMAGNDASTASLIQLTGVHVIFCRAVLAENSGRCFANLTTSVMKMENVEFGGNRFSDAGLRLWNSSDLVVANSSIDDNSAWTGLFVARDTKLRLENGRFEELRGNLVKCENCTLSVYGSLIKDCDAIGGQGKMIITNSKVIGNHSLFGREGTPILAFMRFSQSRNEIHPWCWACEYDSEDDRVIALRPLLLVHGLMITVLATTALIFDANIARFLKSLFLS
jgi:hypothetical protein